MRSSPVPATALFLLSCALLAFACAPSLSLHDSPPGVFTRAENAFERGDFDRAIDAYRAFLDDPSDDAYAPRAWYRLALSQYRLQDYRATLATLRELVIRYPGETWPQADTLRGDAHLALGNIISALLAWEDAWRSANEGQRSALRQRFDRALEGLSDSERARASQAITEAAVRDWIQRPPEASRPLRPDAGNFGTRPEQALLSDTRIGCLLPLSGSHQVFGEQSLRGIQLALGPESERLLVKDTGGEVVQSQRAFADLLASPEVIAIVGPLSSDLAASVAAGAERAHMPLLILAQREGLTGKYVMQAVMTRSQQASTLATHARRADWRYFGILAPADDYGRSFAGKFRAEVERRDGQVTWTGWYDPVTHEVSAAIAGASEQHARGRLDAVFVPDSAPTAIAVASALRVQMPGLGLLGCNDWNDQVALLSAGAVLDETLLVVGFFTDSARPASRAFRERFRKAYSATPDLFAAQAYDAAMLIAEALQRGADSREQIARVLRQIPDVAGATGPVRVTDADNPRELYVVRLRGGRFEEVQTEW